MTLHLPRPPKARTPHRTPGGYIRQIHVYPTFTPTSLFAIIYALIRGPPRSMSNAPSHSSTGLCISQIGTPGLLVDRVVCPLHARVLRATSGSISALPPTPCAATRPRPWLPRDMSPEVPQPAHLARSNNGKASPAASYVL